MSDCVFCHIVTGKIPATVIYQDNQVMAFHDINAQAPVHLLVIPKQHFASIGDLTNEHAALAVSMLQTCVTLAKEHEIADSGYRIVTNVGQEGGQTVRHVHFHLIGGRSMSWPPG